MFIDPRIGKMNVKAQIARALLFPIQMSNNHFKESEDFICFIT